jgi:uncharacterized membrane protein YeaQ/YmgE (transglycosylase-associated protein family)
MDVVTLMTEAVIVGWLATLIMHLEIEHICVFDFAIAVTGAVLAGGLLAPLLGVSLAGEFGLTLSGTLVSWIGATTLLAVANLLRYGRLIRERRSRRRAAPMQPLLKSKEYLRRRRTRFGMPGNEP